MLGQVIYEHVALREVDFSKTYEKIVISELNVTSDRSPKYAYRVTRPGQSAYILYRCKEEGISACSLYGQVMIFSKQKVPQFFNIIMESFSFDAKSELPLPIRPVAYWRGQALICIMEGNNVFVTEDKMLIYVYHEYRKDIPRGTHKIIFKRKKDMEQFLLETKNLMI